MDDEVKVSFLDENGTEQTHVGQIVRKSSEGIAIRYNKKNR